MRLPSWAERILGRPSRADILTAFRAALRWIDANTVPDKGIQVTHARSESYPEVSGYCIPTLLEWGERERALQYARWLISIQSHDGSWSDPGGKAPYTFDTGQILKGLLAVLPAMPEAEAAVRKGCEWILHQIEPSGRVVTPDTRAWKLPGGRVVPEAIHLYALEPLRKAGRLFGQYAYGQAVERALHYYLDHADLTAFNTLSHFHAYVLEALIDLGRPERAAEAMERVRYLQHMDGSVPAYPDVRWVCSTGLAQYSVIWYRLRQPQPAEAAFLKLCRLQNRSGGFFGSYGFRASYFPRQEISWAVKYFLDALSWRVRSSFDSQVDQFPDVIDRNDGRYQLIEQVVRERQPTRVLDIGCGKGRFLKQLVAKFPGTEAFGLDVSERMLDCLPSSIGRLQGGILNIPCSDGFADLVLCVEALEHAINIPGAVGEVARVTGNGGTAVIVDKNRESRRKLRKSDWETWFSEDEVAALLRKAGFSEVRVERNIPYDNRDGRDGLFLGWVARK